MPPRNQLAPIDSFKQELKLMAPQFRALLPKGMTLDKFMSVVAMAVTNNPKLLECTKESLWKACAQSAEVGLSLNPTLAEADILPVENWMTKKLEAQFRPRYKGLMSLALRSGEVTSIRAKLVHEKDEFIVTEGLNPDIYHKPATGDRGALTHAYCVWRLKSQAEAEFEVMDRSQIMKIKARSPSVKSGKGPWSTDEEEMWRKTVVRRATKYMPISCEAFQRAVAVDNIAEFGGEVDITEDGEFIDVTATVHDEPEAAQVAEIEDSLPDGDNIPLVEFSPTDTWQTWCLKAGNAVKAMPKDKRAAWAEAHEALLNEAEEARPKPVARIRELINGAD